MCDLRFKGMGNFFGIVLVVGSFYFIVIIRIRG